MGETGGHYAEWNKPDMDRQMLKPIHGMARHTCYSGDSDKGITGLRLWDQTKQISGYSFSE